VDEDEIVRLKTVHTPLLEKLDVFGGL